MIRLHTLTEGIAVRLLARKGIATIWELQVAAAHRAPNRKPERSSFHCRNCRGCGT
jgi:hypothetical protein